MALDTPQVAQMLHTMILIREFDERAIQLRVAGKIYGAVHPYVGQEAVAVGVCSNLVAFAEQSPFPDPKDLLVDMFAD